MTQTIAHIKLKAAAEHLEWVLKQYPNNEDVRALPHGLPPLIEDAKAGSVKEPIKQPPFEPRFSNGNYRNHKNPNIEDAYY
ncbi:hypothetical protein EBB59_10980 [Lysobacter pythonis]|uniref:Uncharacterized protein n=1 Tax=Solilutibacter pythonis TaxID=2483112 RepID=A0A3M2HNS7_9GAMM|nr:hypothetical protein [Lysobacter pythonis]RMH88989.1 hypothetical protein EBB59_10980 [Lysobacter pythonis]